VLSMCQVADEVLAKMAALLDRQSR
jgi:hypothetical protein